MVKLEARKMLSYHPDDLWDVLTGAFVLVFDDGEIETNYKETIYSNYFWDFHRKYPETPMLMRHHVHHILLQKPLNARTHNALLTIINRDVCSAYKFTMPMDIWPLSLLISNITNNLYNALVQKIDEYVVGLDILDFLEVTEYPLIKTALENVTEDPDSVKETKRTILSIMNTDPIIKDNPLCGGLRSSLLKADQVVQCVGLRGFVADIDSKPFPHPVLKGFVHGLDTLHDSLIESRSASRALFFSKGQLEDAEYFARRLQLQTMMVDRIHEGDCGSQEYLEWIVKESDIRNLAGKYYLGPDGKTLEVITPNSTHLANKILKIRSPVAGCQHPDPHGICSVCFGTMTVNTLLDTNLGHNCAATTTHQTTQGVLSTKHIDASNASDSLYLSEAGKKFFTIKLKTLELFLKPITYHNQLNLIIEQKDVLGILDIQTLDNFDDLNLSRVSSVSLVSVQYDSKNDITSIPIQMGQRNREPFFTKDFLIYIKKKGWTVDNRGCFVIDMKDWSVAKPIMMYPVKHENMGEHSKTVASLIESSIGDIGDRIKSDSPVLLLSELFDTVNKKLSVNIALLEVIVYGGMVRSIEDGDYRIPKVGTPKSLSVISLNIANRSLSAELAYEHQFESTRNPASFFKDRRSDHIMDCFIKPYEVGQYYRWYDRK